MEEKVKIRPLFNRVLVSMEKYDVDVVNSAGIVITPKGTLKDVQTVLAIGSTVRDINVGDKVHINPVRYAVKKYQEGSLKDGVITDNSVIGYDFNLVPSGADTYIMLYDNDIDYIVDD